MKQLWVKISYWWFVIMLFIVGLLSGKLKVNAATLNITNDSGYSIYSCEGPTNITSHSICGQSVSSGKVAFNTAVHPAYTTYGSAALFYGSSNFLASNTYTITYRTHFNGDTDAINFIKSDFKHWTYIVNGYVNSTTGYSDTYVTAYGCSSRFDTTTINGFITNCTIQLNSNVSRLQIKTTYWDTSKPMYKYIDYSVDTIRTQFQVINYSEGIGSQIDNQTIVIEHQTEVIEDVKDTITSDDVDNPSSFIEDMEDLLPSNGVITQLLTLPITLYQKVLNSINGTCSQFDLGALYGTHLIMPCINLQTYLGSTLWNTIDLIMSGVFVLVIARKMVKAFNSFTFMKEGDVIND